MTPKRKEANITIPKVDPANARDAAAPNAPSSRNYPRAAELASDGAWAAWLQTTLASVLRPAAVAGAMSLAACSLAQGSDAPLPPPPIAVAPEAPPCEIPAPPTTGTMPSSTGASVPTPSYSTTLVAIPTPPMPRLPPPPPPVDPTRRQREQTQQRHQVPDPNPRPMPGGIRPAQIDPPIQERTTAGAPPSVQPI